MKCHRCHGWMVNEKFYGRGSFFWGWRCVSCGEILDPVILENRNVCRGPVSPPRSGFAVENGGRR